MNLHVATWKSRGTFYLRLKNFERLKAVNKNSVKAAVVSIQLYMPLTCDKYDNKHNVTLVSSNIYDIQENKKQV